MNDSTDTPNPVAGPVFLRLIVDDAAAAIDFYIAAFGATEVARFTDPSGAIVHAEVQIGEGLVSLTESDGDANPSPNQLGGSPVIAMLNVDGVDAVAAAMVAAGAEAVYPVDDRPYGRRDGRYRDPAGHLWIIGQDSEELTDEEIQDRLG